MSPTGPWSAPALTDALRRAGWAALLPAHRADGDDQPLGRPTCVATQPLGAGLVLAVVEDERGRAYPVPLVMDAAGVRRAVPGDGAGEALLDLVRDGPRSVGDFVVSCWHHRPATGERAVTVDQTNESVVVGEQAVVKWTVVADEGPHPAPSLLAELERNRFTGMPVPWGVLQWRPHESASPRMLAVVVDFVPGAVDGWTWVVDDLRSAASTGDEQQARSAGRCAGELVASFHGALRGTARAATEEEAAAWRSGAVADLDRALTVTRGPARDLLARSAGPVRQAFGRMPRGGPVMRVHGDLHVGQVLRAETGPAPAYVLTDFDGNPVVPPQDRIREQPAALDVAGMAQAFVHVGLVVRRHHPDLEASVVTRLAQLARTSFLEAYRSGLGEHADLLDDGLLRPFALRQVCREFTYAATHLPRWSYVPEAALPMLLKEAQ